MLLDINILQTLTFSDFQLLWNDVVIEIEKFKSKAAIECHFYLLNKPTINPHIKLNLCVVSSI